MHAEFVLTFHTLMHHEAQSDGAFFSRPERRRTDDSTGRSAPLDKLDLRLAQNLQWAVAHIAHTENGLDIGIQPDIAVVNEFFRNLQPRGA